MTTYTAPSTLLVTTTGGWARPGWRDLIDETDPGRFGPADDVELLDDYCTLAIADQERCGLDIVTDGEHRRGGWIEAMSARLPGIVSYPAPRRLGAIGYDMLPAYELREPLDNLESLWDFSTEFAFLRDRTDRRPRVGIPGPYGMTTQLRFGEVYKSRRDCARAFVDVIRRHIVELVEAGCDYIQLEEPVTPSYAHDDRTAADMVDMINSCVSGISGCTFTVHICFGSFRRLPYAKRTYAALFPTLLDADVHGFSLEFAGREMAEIEMVGDWGRERILSAGLIDIKTHYAETKEDLVERIRTCLRYRDPERLEISTDCGLRRVPRELAIRKMEAASAAAGEVRDAG
jgi:5-methyltetrahydropteroyltriglutamate--homocysteine methyltransferase